MNLSRYTKKVSKFLSVMLMAAMFFSVVPIEELHAEEIQNDIVSEEAVIDEEQNGDPLIEEEKQLEGEQQSEADADNREENLSEYANDIQYAVLGKTEVIAPGEWQNIVVGIGEEGTVIDHAVLNYKNTETGEQFSVEEDSIEGNAISFVIYYEAESQSGIYQLVSVAYQSGEVEETLDVEVYDMLVQWGVNESVSVNPDGYIVEDTEEAETVTPDEETMATEISTLDFSGQVIKSETIGSAIEDAQAQTASVMALSDADSNQAVIVLDPGHDDTHPGAQAFGAGEEKLTLKIAKYCKQILENEYEDVVVILSRPEDGSCPVNGADESLCLKSRVQVAADNNADAIVSLHLDAAVSSAHGATVYYPNSNWKPTVGSEGKELASLISQKLVALGLYNRGIQVKTDDEETYPDGSLNDYYSIIRNAKIAGIPGIIVEHAFLTNQSDYNNYLSSDAKLQKLAEADAKGIAEYFGLTKEASVAVDDGTYTISSAVDVSKILSVKGNSSLNSADVVLTASNSVSAWSRLEVHDAGKGYYRIEIEGTGKVLDVRNGSSSNGARVQQYEWNGSDAQLWKFVDAGNGYYYIRSKLGKYLDLPSGNAEAGNYLQLYASNKSSAQKWKLNTVDYQSVEEGTYIIASALNNSKVMDIASGSTANGGNVQLYQKNNTSAQKFTINYVGEGYYKIIASGTSKVLDVAAASRADGANLQQYTWNGTVAQLWKFVDAGNGYYYIKSKLGTTIDVLGGNSANGTNIQLYSLNSSSAQKWKLLNSDSTEIKYVAVEDGTYTIKTSANTNQVLDVNAGGLNNGCNIQIYKSNGTSAQRFEVSSVGNGYYKITNEKSGKALDITNGSSSSGVNLQQYTWNGTDAQLWRFIDAGDGNYYIESKLGTVMDLYGGNSENGSNVWMYSLNSTSTQKWILEDTEEQLIQDGIYTFYSALNSNKVIDINAASKANGGNAQLWTSNETSAQKFKITYIANGYYKITSVNSGKVLDVSAGSKSNGANLQQYTSNDTDAQLWKFLSAENGYYYIRSKLGTVIDITSAHTSDGTNIQLYQLNGTNAQLWKPVKADATYKIMGSSNYTVAQLANYYNTAKPSGVTYPYSDVTEADTIQKLAQIYVEECKAEGVKVEVAFCQAMKETGFLRYGGSVKAEQYNFAGLGATDSGGASASFETIREGVRAQVQHLKAYASKESLVNECVDPRFNLVTRGSAIYVEWLGIKENPDGKGWASAENYGYSIINDYINVLKKC